MWIEPFVPFVAQQMWCIFSTIWPHDRWSVEKLWMWIFAQSCSRLWRPPKYSQLDRAFACTCFWMPIPSYTLPKQQAVNTHFSITSQSTNTVFSLWYYSQDLAQLWIPWSFTSTFPVKPLLEAILEWPVFFLVDEFLVLFSEFLLATAPNNPAFECTTHRDTLNAVNSVIYNFHCVDSIFHIFSPTIEDTWVQDRTIREH